MIHLSVTDALPFDEALTFQLTHWCFHCYSNTEKFRKWATDRFFKNLLYSLSSCFSVRIRVICSWVEEGCWCLSCFGEQTLLDQMVLQSKYQKKMGLLNENFLGVSWQGNKRGSWATLRKKKKKSREEIVSSPKNQHSGYEELFSGPCRLGKLVWVEYSCLCMWLISMSPVPKIVGLCQSHVGLTKNGILQPVQSWWVSGLGVQPTLCPSVTWKPQPLVENRALFLSMKQVEQEGLQIRHIFWIIWLVFKSMPWKIITLWKCP